jgi:hypothetical protein
MEDCNILSPNEPIPQNNLMPKRVTHHVMNCTNLYTSSQLVWRQTGHVLTTPWRRNGAEVYLHALTWKLAWDERSVSHSTCFTRGVPFIRVWAGGTTSLNAMTETKIPLWNHTGHLATERSISASCRRIRVSGFSVGNLSGTIPFGKPNVASKISRWVRKTLDAKVSIGCNCVIGSGHNLMVGCSKHGTQNPGFKTGYVCY